MRIVLVQATCVLVKFVEVRVSYMLAVMEFEGGLRKTDGRFMISGENQVE